MLSVKVEAVREICKLSCHPHFIVTDHKGRCIHSIPGLLRLSSTCSRFGRSLCPRLQKNTFSYGVWNTGCKRKTPINTIANWLLPGCLPLTTVTGKFILSRKCHRHWQMADKYHFPRQIANMASLYFLTAVKRCPLAPRLEKWRGPYLESFLDCALFFLDQACKTMLLGGNALLDTAKT